MPRVKNGNLPLRLLDGALAAVLILSFNMPWLSFLGSPVKAHEIRERLRGPHRLVSAFTDDSRISLDYSLSILLWIVPCAAGLVLVLVLARGGNAWSSLAAGAAAGAAFLFLRFELRAYPFQRLEEGAYLALAAGAGLLLVGALRLLRGAARN